MTLRQRRVMTLTATSMSPTRRRAQQLVRCTPSNDAKTRMQPWLRVKDEDMTATTRRGEDDGEDDVPLEFYALFATMCLPPLIEQRRMRRCRCTDG